VPVWEFQYHEDFDRFVRHHELLMHLLNQRSRLNREIHAFHDDQVQKGFSWDKPNTASRDQFRHIAKSILVSEGRILSLLSFMSSPAEAVGNMILANSSHSVYSLPDSKDLKRHQIQTDMGLENQPWIGGDWTEFQRVSIEHLDKLRAWYPLGRLTVRNFVFMCSCILLYWSFMLISYFFFKSRFPPSKVNRYLVYPLDLMTASVILNSISTISFLRRFWTYYIFLIAFCIGGMVTVHLIIRLWAALIAYVAVLVLSIGWTFHRSKISLGLTSETFWNLIEYIQY
jgi:hypothetical protein